MKAIRRVTQLIQGFFNRGEQAFLHFIQRYGIWLFLISVTVISIYAKYQLFHYTSGDYEGFLQHWFDFYKENGGFAAFGANVGDYTPTYRLIICALTYLPINSLFSIKAVSVIFDVVLASGIYLIVLTTSKKSHYAAVAYALTLIFPTFIINSALWAQCDGIFTSFVVYSLFFMIKGRYKTAIIFFGISFAFKLQAIFFFPIFLLMWWKGLIKFRHFFFIPLIYLITILPSLIAGGDLLSLLTIYLNQMNSYPQLSLSAPSFYSFFDNSYSELIGTGAVATALILVGAMIYYWYQETRVLTTTHLIYFAYAFTLIVPFILPRMHERYFYLADAIGIVVLFTIKKIRWSVLLAQIASFICVSSYFFAINFFGGSFNLVRIAAMINLVAIILLLINYGKYIQQHQEE